jgi:TrmH family RNA methyltransferase
VLAGVADPGNAGTLLRVAEASGVGAVVFGGDAVDAYNPKCVRASAGAVFRVPIVDREPLSAVLDRLGGSGHAVIATRADATTAYDSLDYTGPVAFLLGNEAHGLDNHLDLQVTDTVSIPMAGRTESLNVAMTGAVLCFEAARQRRAGLAAGH